VMQEVARLGSRRLEVARKLDLVGIVREFAAGVLVELDYRNEAYNARRLAEDLKKFETIHIPAVYEDYSTSRVLTEEFVSGIKISNVEALDAAGLDRCEIATVFVRSLVKQVLIDGFFHGDPHPGNILVDPATGTMHYIDLGMVGQLRADQRLSLLDLIFSLTNRDYEGVATTMIALSRRTPRFDEVAFRRAIEQTLRRYLDYGQGKSLSEGLNAVVSVVYDSGLRLDNQLTIGLKALIQGEETARALSSTVDIAQAAFDESREAMLDRLNQENVERLIRKEAMRVGRQVMQRVPNLESAIWKWVDQFGAGQLTIKVDTADLGTQFGTLNKIGGMLSTGLILAGALIGLAIVAVALLQPALGAGLGPVPGLAAGAFLVLMVYAIRQVRRFVSMTEDEEEKY
jgi:ubiquinone biosynthesis protein